MYMMQMYTVKTRNSQNNNKRWCFSLCFTYACIFREQRNLQGKISLEDDRIVKEMLSSSSSDTFYIGGMDISFFEGDNVNACAALVVCSYPDLEVPKFLNHAKWERERERERERVCMDFVYTCRKWYKQELASEFYYGWSTSLSLSLSLSLDSWFSCIHNIITSEPFAICFTRNNACIMYKVNIPAWTFDAYL